MYRNKPVVYKSKHSINKTDMEKVKQENCETYNYAKSKPPKGRVNDCSKVKLHGLVKPLHLFGYGFLGSLGSTDY